MFPANDLDQSNAEIRSSRFRAPPPPCSPGELPVVGTAGQLIVGNAQIDGRQLAHSYSVMDVIISSDFFDNGGI